MKKVKKILAKATPKIQKAAITVSMIISTVSMGMIDSFAAPITPAGIQTTELNAIVKILKWLVIIAIGGAGGYTSIHKITEGQANEDVRGRNSGIAGLCVCAASIGAVYGISYVLFGA